MSIAARKKVNEGNIYYQWSGQAVYGIDWSITQALKRMKENMPVDLIVMSEKIKNQKTVICSQHMCIVHVYKCNYMELKIVSLTSTGTLLIVYHIIYNA